MSNERKITHAVAVDYPPDIFSISYFESKAEAVADAFIKITKLGWPARIVTLEEVDEIIDNFCDRKGKENG